MTALPALPPNILSYVSEFVSRARGRALRRAAGLAVSVFLAWGLACCTADRLLQLPSWVRAALLAAGLLTVGVILYRPMRARWRRKLDWLEAAAEVERHNPRFGQRLLTVTARMLGPAEHRGSDDLLYRLLSDVDREAALRRPAPAVPGAAVFLPWAAAACLVALTAALARVDTLGLPRLALRFVAPFADIDPVTTTRIRVTPGDAQVVQSAPLRVEAAVERLPPGEVVWFEWSEQGDDWLRRVMSREPAAGTNRYALTLPGVDRDLRYRVMGGDFRSREFSVAVLRPPAVAEFKLRYVYPAYSDRPPATVANTDGLIEAPAGTETTVTITATEPLQSALLRMGSERILMTRGPRDGENVRHATFKLTRTGPYDLDLISTREIAGGGPPGMVARALADRKPLVRLLNAGEALRLNPRDVLPLSYQALDDFGIDSLVVRAQVAGGTSVERAVPREGDPRRSEGTFNFDLAEIKLALGDLLTICLVARDRSGQQETSESVQVLVSPRSVDLETHQRITELEAAAQLAGLVAEELDATAKAQEESRAQKGANPEASLAASGRGNRFLTTATDTAVLARQSILRAIVRGRSPELAVALSTVADSTQLVTAGGSELFRNNALADGEAAVVRDALHRLLERAGKVRETLAAVAQGERAAAILADRENLAATEKRAAVEPRNAAAVRQTLQRAREDVAAGVKGLGLDPAAPSLDEQLRGRVEAERVVLKSQTPIDFAEAARAWAREVQRDPLRRLPLEDRLALAAQAEAVRPAADLSRARDLQLASRGAARVASDAASDKYAGRPVAAAPLDQFAAAVAAVQREHDLNRRPADVRPPDEVKAVRQSAAEARALLAQWAGEPAPGAAPAPTVFADGRPRFRRAEGAAMRGGAELASRDYAAAREADRELLRQLSESSPAAADPTTTPATGPVAATQDAPAYLRRDFDRVDRLTDRAETIDRVQSDQERLAQETQSSAAQPSTPEAPALVDRQLDVAQRIEEVAAHDDPSAPEPVPSILARNADDPNWRGRATAAVVRAQEQLAAMPQHLTRAQEEAAALRQAVERVEMAKREAAAAPPDRKSALDGAARQAEQEWQTAEQRFRAAVAPVAASAAEALSARLAPFEPEGAAARQVLGGELAGALRDFEQASLQTDPAAADRALAAAAAARQAIDAAQRELAAAQDEFTSRDPLVAAKWFARAAADSLTRSPPDFQSAYRRQMDTSQALSRAWDRTVHDAAAQRLSLVPSMQSLFGVAVPAPVLAAGKRAGEQKVGGPVSDMASVREWGRLRTREVEELNAPLRETDAPGYEKALQLYFESLGKSAGEGAK
jgi:hypothetical protein